MREQDHVQPRSSDILLGRGGRNHENIGNQTLRKKAKDLAPEYAQLTKSDKADMINNVLGDLLRNQVRFLRCKRPFDGTQYWEVADVKTARGKVSQDLREAVKILKRNQARKSLQQARSSGRSVQ